MCTLIVALAPGTARPLLVGANRDEDLSRPWQGPRWRDFGARRAFAPKDLVGGGTWMGLSDAGIFVALTNRYGIPPYPERRSRGALVARALSAVDLSDIESWAATLRGAEERGFHLFATDGRAALLLVGDGARIEIRRLGRGVHVITERAFGAAPSGRQSGLEARFEGVEPEAIDPETVAALLADHSGGPFDGVCVHVPEKRYGTRSAAIVERFADGAVRWLTTEGPPCTAPWRASTPTDDASDRDGSSPSDLG